MSGSNNCNVIDSGCIIVREGKVALVEVEVGINVEVAVVVEVVGV